MKYRAYAPNVIVVAVIILGGFGLLRMVLLRHDPVGMLSLLSSLALVGVFRRLMTTKNPIVRRTLDVPKWPISLTSNANNTFTVFPGRPDGYAGYTDYTAMSVDVNDDLAARDPNQQFTLVGFGVGFLSGIYGQLTDLDRSHRLMIRADQATQAEREYIGWLVYLQRSGTDNAGQSTENLSSVLKSIATEMHDKGPISMGFWEKVHHKKTEGLDVSGTSLEALVELNDMYHRAFRDGEKLSSKAAISRTTGVCLLSRPS